MAGPAVTGCECSPQDGLLQWLGTTKPPGVKKTFLKTVLKTVEEHGEAHLQVAYFWWDCMSCASSGGPNAADLQCLLSMLRVPCLLSADHVLQPT